MLVGIEQTDLLEQEMESSTSYFDCFKGSNLPRTEISVMVYLIQVIGGNPLIGYANYFFEQAGLASSDAFASKTLPSLRVLEMDSVANMDDQWALETLPWASWGQS